MVSERIAQGDNLFCCDDRSRGEIDYWMDHYADVFDHRDHGIAATKGKRPILAKVQKSCRKMVICSLLIPAQNCAQGAVLGQMPSGFIFPSPVPHFPAFF